MKSHPVLDRLAERGVKLGLDRMRQLLTELGERIRDVRQGLDGYLYVLTDSDNGRLVRVVPR